MGTFEATDATPVVDAAGVRYTYDGEGFALNGVNLSVRAGEFVCVLGGNGSGKSTFAKQVNALLVPDEGRVLTCGLDTADPELVYDIRSGAGMVFQNPDDQIVATLVESDVAFGPENLGVPTSELAQRVSEALEQVGLAGFETHETHALSGGQKQRVAIAGVLAMAPQVLILDEATSMLDPRGRAGLMKVCRALNAQGMAIVMITHFMDEAAEADRVLVFDAGRVALEGRPAEVFSHAEELAALNLEFPAAVKLGLALRERGMDAPACVREADEVNALARLLAKQGDAAMSAAREGKGAAASSERYDEAAMVLDENGVHAGLPAALAASKVGGEAPAEQMDGSAGLPAPAPSGSPLIRLEHVSYSYEPSVRERAKKRKRKGAKQAKWGNDPNEVWALHDVDLAVYEGEFLGIAGHTGSGKSTLIQHLNGLLAPTEGRVLVRGFDLADKKAAATARHMVGVVFQYPEHQLFAETVFADVAFGPRNLGLSEAEVEARVHEALASVGLSTEEVGDKSPFELSGGQQRRVAFAGVLAMEPKVLVLDEPAAGLDPAARKNFLQLISRLRQERGLSVVMVSHNMDDLAELCDRMVVLNEGSIVREGTPAEVFRDAQGLKQVGLGLPAAQRMAVALEEVGLPVNMGRLYTVDSLAEALCDLPQVQQGRCA